MAGKYIGAREREREGERERERERERILFTLDLYILNKSPEGTW